MLIKPLLRYADSFIRVLRLQIHEPIAKHTMCGRFIVTSPEKNLAEHFGLFEEPKLSPRYNIAPTEEIAAIRRDPDSNGKRLTSLKWGLVQSIVHR